MSHITLTVQEKRELWREIERKAIDLDILAKKRHRS